MRMYNKIFAMSARINEDKLMFSKNRDMSDEKKKSVAKSYWFCYNCHGGCLMLANSCRISAFLLLKLFFGFIKIYKSDGLMFRPEYNLWRAK